MACVFLSIPEGVSVATVALMGWMRRLRIERDERLILGSPGAALRTLGSVRRKAVRQSRRDRAEVAVPEAEIAAKAWTRTSRHPPDHTTGILASFASTQPFASLSTPRKRQYRFHPGRSYAQRSLTSESHYFVLARLRERANGALVFRKSIP